MHHIIMPKAVYCGTNSLSRLPDVFSANNVRRAAIFTYPGIVQSGLFQSVADEIDKTSAEYIVLDDLAVEPTIEQATQTIDRFRGFDADILLAVGGGSVMDVVKLVSILAGAPYSLEDLLRDASIGRKMVPTVMVPTTAGTGSEATPNSIVCDEKRQLKIGLVNDTMVSDYVILAPEMIRHIPRAIAASTGVDALAHGIECFTSRKATPLSDIYALETVKLVFRHIEDACDPAKRTDEALTAMMMAALYGGMAITGSGTTAVHALSYPLGGRYHIPHGVANAILLEPVMRFNCDACIERLGRIYDAVYPQTPASIAQKADVIIERLAEIVRKLDIPTSLTAFGVHAADLEELVASGMAVTRLLSNNIKIVTEADTRGLYEHILQ